MMIARRCCCSAISVLFQTTRPRSVLVSHKQKNSSLLSSIDRSHFFFVFFFERFFLYQNREDCVAKAVLFFSSFQEKLLRKNGSFCVFATKKEKFSSANLSTWSPLLSTPAHSSAPWRCIPLLNRSVWILPGTRLSHALRAVREHLPGVRGTVAI